MVIIKFNDPHILRGYVMQAIPQLVTEDLEGTTDKLTKKLLERRIIVGNNDGLGYKLFDIEDLPTTVKINNLSELEGVKAYSALIDSYIKLAGEHAKRYSFGLIRIEIENAEKKLVPDYTQSTHFATVAIGDCEIEPVTRFTQFIDMIKAGYAPFKERYDAILQASKAFKNN